MDQSKMTMKQQIAQVAELAKTLGVEPDQLHQLLQEALDSITHTV